MKTTILSEFNAGARNFGFVEGPNGYIITENDFVHSVFGLNEPADLNTAAWGTFGREYKTFSLADIRPLARPVTSFRKWAHYWGIKPRIHSNYCELLASMKEIGADTTGMPEWGEESAPTPQTTPWNELPPNPVNGV